MSTKTRIEPRLKYMKGGWVRVFLLFSMVVGFSSTTFSDVFSTPSSSKAVLGPFTKGIEVAFSKCVQLKVRSGREFLINSCNICRSVAVKRRRPGISAPILRRYTVPAGSYFPMPFRGPGQTRISNDTPCKGNPNTNSFNSTNSSDQKKAPGIKCASIKRDVIGNVFLTNSCTHCREVVIVRFNKGNQLLGQQLVKMAPSQNFVLPPRGAAKVGVARESPCKKQ